MNITKPDESKRDVLINARWRFEIFDKDEDRFLKPEEYLTVRLGLTPKGYLYFPDNETRYILIHYTNRSDDSGQELLEGDIIEADEVSEFGLIKRQGIMRWDVPESRYVVDVFNDIRSGQVASVQNIKRIGNGLVDKELLNKLLNEAKEQAKTE